MSAWCHQSVLVSHGLFSDIIPLAHEVRFTPARRAAATWDSLVLQMLINILFILIVRARFNFSIHGHRAAQYLVAEGSNLPRVNRNDEHGDRGSSASC
jgi:hypothetical protein